MIAETRSRIDSLESAEDRQRLLLYFRTILDHADRIQSVAARLAYRRTDIESDEGA